MKYPGEIYAKLVKYKKSQKLNYRRIHVIMKIIASGDNGDHLIEGREYGDYSKNE